MSSMVLMPVLHPGRMTWDDRRTSIPAWLPRAREEWRLRASKACSVILGTSIGVGPRGMDRKTDGRETRNGALSEKGWNRVWLLTHSNYGHG